MFRLSMRAGDSDTPYARRGQVVRTLYLLASGLCWLAMCIFHKPRGGVVLCYHSVRRSQLRRFAWQMRHVAGRATSLGRPRPAAEPRGWPRVCVTFDDGFQNIVRYALPAMHALGVPATLFIVTGNLGAAPLWPMPVEHPDRDEPLASAAELASAVHAGLCAVGSHTRTHARMPQMATEQLISELCSSKSELEALLDTDIAALAFPYGEYDGTSVQRALEAGYEHLFTLEPRLWYAAPQGNLIGRFLVSADMWRAEFVLTCAGAYAWLGGWRRFWRAVWGARRAASQEALAR